MSGYYDKLDISQVARELLLINTLVAHETKFNRLLINLETSHLNYQIIDLNDYGKDYKLIVVLLNDVIKRYILIDLKLENSIKYEYITKSKYMEIDNGILRKYIAFKTDKDISLIKCNLDEMFNYKKPIKIWQKLRLLLLYQQEEVIIWKSRI